MSKYAWKFVELLFVNRPKAAVWTSVLTMFFVSQVSTLVEFWRTLNVEAFW